MNDAVFKMNLSPENIKFFVYRNERYPFDYDFLKRTSTYISKNDQKFRTQTNINLVDDQSIDLSPESIRNFILCCENQKFHVNESNVFNLHFLSVRYEVAYLQNITKKYITDHQDHFALESLLAKESLNIDDTTFIENIISENLFSYINKEGFLLLPIPVLYRLIKRYTDKSNQEDNPNNENLVDFLFKCLDKHGKNASILFSLINLENYQINVIQKLLSEPYYNIFDFTFINSTLLKTTKDLSSMLSRLEIKYSQELTSMKQLHSEFERMKEQFETKFIPKAESISITPHLNSINADEEVTLAAVVQPENAIKIVKWSVSDNKMQIKNANGEVDEYVGSKIILRGIHDGESTLTAMAIDGSNIQTKVTVSIFQRVKSITIEPNVSKISINEEVKITANCEPKDASNKNVKWKISGNRIQMKDSSGNEKSEVIGREIVLRGISEGVSTLTATAEDGSNVQLQTSITVSTVNLLNYANGARVTYVSISPYNTGSNFLVSKNSGYTGSNSPVNSNLSHSQDNFWGASNTYSTQGAVENDDNKNSINLNHDGASKNVYSSTTLNVSGSSKTSIVIINPRAYYGDISKFIFKMSECYLASAQADGDVGKFKIYVSTSNDESVATNPNDSSWTYVTDGSLSTDITLTKVYSGGVNFKFIKLELNSRGKNYMELAAIKVF